VTPPGTPDCDRFEDLLGPYALDAVDPDEARLVDAHLEGCPRCRQEVDGYRETVGLLAAAGGPAPKPVWDRIADRIGPTAGAPVSAGVPVPAGAPASAGVPVPAGAPASAGPDAPSASGPGFRAGPGRRVGSGARSRWTRPVRAAGLAAAAAVVVLLGVGTVRIANLDRQVHRLTTAVGQGNGALGTALVDPSARHVTLTAATTGRPVGQLVVLPSGESYLVGSTLPALAQTRTYQLWSMVGGRAVSVSLLGAHPSTVAFRTDPNVPPQAYLVTVEPAGGVVAPTSSPVAMAPA